MPPPPSGVSPPPQWGDIAMVRERLGSAVKDILFDRACMLFPALSVQNYRDYLERTAGPMVKLIAPYFEDNIVRQDYLLTRAVKV